MSFTARFPWTWPASLTSPKSESSVSVNVDRGGLKIPAGRAQTGSPLRLANAITGFSEHDLILVVSLRPRFPRPRILGLGLHDESKSRQARICQRVLYFPKKFNWLREFLNFPWRRLAVRAGAEIGSESAGRVKVADWPILAVTSSLGGT
jgi:hypothetical protein